MKRKLFLLGLLSLVVALLPVAVIATEQYSLEVSVNTMPPRWFHREQGILIITPDNRFTLSAFLYGRDYDGWLFEVENEYEIQWFIEGKVEGDYIGEASHPNRAILTIGSDEQERYIVVRAALVEHPSIYYSVTLRVEPERATRIEIMRRIPRRVAPNFGEIHLTSWVYNQMGDSMQERGVWSVEGSLAEGDIFISDLSLPWVAQNNRLYIGSDETYRTITLRVTAYTNPAIYDIITITVDPNLPAIQFDNPRSTLWGGAPGTLTYNFIARNIPDGVYPASIRRPLCIMGIPDGVTATDWDMYYTEDGELRARGYVAIENGTGFLTLLVDDTVSGEFTWTRVRPDEEPRAWNFSRQYADLLLELDIGSRYVRDYFSMHIQYEIEQISLGFYRGYWHFLQYVPKNDITHLPSSDLEFRLRAIDQHGEFMTGNFYDGIILSMEGAVEGDGFSFEDGVRTIYIGDDRRQRTIVLTATSVFDPHIYDSITIRVDPYFVDEARTIILNTYWPLPFTRMSPNSSRAFAPAAILNQYNFIVQNPRFALLDAEYANGDEVRLYEWGAVIYTGSCEQERAVSVTLGILNEDNVVIGYETFTVGVAETHHLVWNSDYFTINSSSFPTFNLGWSEEPYILDMGETLFLPFTTQLQDIWYTGELFLPHGVTVDGYGDVGIWQTTEFAWGTRNLIYMTVTDGTGTLALVSDGTTGIWHVRMNILRIDLLIFLLNTDALTDYVAREAAMQAILLYTIGDTITLTVQESSQP